MSRLTQPTLYFAALSALLLCACAYDVVRAESPATPSRTAPIKETVMQESAKRRVPRVDPVVAKGVRYEIVRGARSRGFAQNGGILSAVDVASGKELWTLQVYVVHYDPAEEADVQDVFITEMKLDAAANVLLLKNEERKSFKVNLADRSVAEIQ